jgi:hypothetical protein
MKLSKTQLLIFFVAAASIGVIFIYFTILKKQQAPITEDSLSPRALEFIAEQKSDGTGLWSQVQFNESSTAPSEQIIKGLIDTGCFSFSLPFSVLDTILETSESRCSWKAKISSHRGLIIVSSYQVNNFDEDSGIILRKKFPEKYREVMLSNTVHDDLLFFRSDEDLTTFARSGTTMITVSITNMTQPEKFSNEDIQNIINSITIKTTLPNQ